MRQIAATVATGSLVLLVLMTAQDARAQGDRQKFVGTYRLVQTEIKDASGNWIRNPNFNSVGFITYDESGYMGVHIMPKGRAKFAASRPTPDEAQQAIRGYAAYFGAYRVHDEVGERFIEHDRSVGGTINETSFPIFKRYYDFVGNQLILTPGDRGITKAQATNRLIWERMPEAQLSAEAKRFVGTYKLQYTDRYTVTNGQEKADGARTDARAGSVIIYTKSGHMMVHLRNKEGRVRYAGAQPTPEEALASYSTWVGYFGTFEPHPEANPPYLFHHLAGALNPAMGPDFQRFYQFTGNVLRLATPPTNIDGKMSGGYLYWERLPPEAR